MSDENQSESQSPFTRPGFIAAAIVVALIVVFAIILVVVNATGGNPKAAPTSTATSTSPGNISSPGPASGDKSVCGLGGTELSGSVTAPPSASWKYEGTTAYPASSTYGPGKTDPAGFRYCFQHSPTGALFMAANAVSQGSGSESKPWLSYVLAEGPYRSQLLNQGSPSNNAGTRTSVAGFRVLSYDGRTASVDLAVQVATSNGTVTLSSVYSLTWVDGDWKVSTNTATPIDVAPIPNVAGYTTWGE